jgi:wyosine [tRNA(Phe)-imidazoG37] synthetase (radical SAM superfamily)
VKTVSTSGREFFNNRFVYCVISQRAGGLSIGVNMNPDKHCNFNCVYCEVDRSSRQAAPARIDLDVMIAELQNKLQMAHSPSLRESGYRGVPGELLSLKEVALSGDGEPTLCPNFSNIVEPIMHLRALELFPFFKVVLITNCCGLHLSDVQAGLAMFDPRDEVWAKLDAGTQGYMDVVNQPDVQIEFVLNNILGLARKRPVIIQSLFAQINGALPPEEEITQFAARLRWLKESGANIPLVQLYSAHRPAVNRGVTHLPLRVLSAIAKRVREISGLKTEVF